MKMLSPNLRVVLEDLKLTMQGSPAPARLQITSSLAQEIVTNVPYSQGGAWNGKHVVTFEATLSDLLQAPEYEYLTVTVFDADGLQQGEVQLTFRQLFCISGEKLSFKQPVTYQVESGDSSFAGNVGELTGSISYENLPAYAQMRGGLYRDGSIQDGFCLYPDLPYPASCNGVPPPVWEDPSNHQADEDRLNDVQSSENSLLAKIGCPPRWEKRTDSNGKVYFAHSSSKRTTRTDPRFLPEHWEQRIDTNDRVFFAYHKSRQTTYTDPRGCPRDWEMRLSRSGQIYYAYFPAMRTTYSDPRGLPRDWEVALDDLGRIYYKDHEQKTTVWDDPREGEAEETLQLWRGDQLVSWIAKQAGGEDH